MPTRESISSRTGSARRHQVVGNFALECVEKVVNQAWNVFVRINGLAAREASIAWTMRFNRADAAATPAKANSSGLR
jgi:hypothetical protein